MLFAGSDRDGVASGRITVAYRRWAEPRVAEGRVYRTNAGRIEVDSIRQVNPELIADTDADLELADRQNARDVRRRLRGDESLPTYLIRFHLVEGPDPRDELASQSVLSSADLADLRERLDRFDALSNHGPWTLQTLQLIESTPAVRAADLAASVGRETAPFKLDVRKLKNLGLTYSLEVGYRISPRGAAYLDATRSA
ncbi:hypothetical protein [Kribbella sp.]|uniref:hypothetical protein n=1 Tax=Kribbella sp. TaxID=1871183 RepID=UPI002D71CB5C|nr:hypothetical protein [Kribbella sp.]HZX09219.1 hypothetical protein [Kribbella sp.]